MSYISHEDFKNLMSKFQAETPKGMLKEAVEEKKELTPKQKKFAALAPPKDEITYADRMAGIKKGMNEGDDEVNKKLERIADLHKGKKIDFETIEKIAKALEGQGHEVNARYVQKFLSQHGVEMNEYGYADNYPGSWGYKEGDEKKPHTSATGRGIRESGTGDTPIDKMTRKEMIEFLGTTEEKAEGMSDEELRDEVGEKSRGMEEGIHTPPLQATGQTISTTEADTMASSLVTNPGAQTELKGPGLNLEKLTSDERKQLQEFVEAIHTTKKAVEELLEKASGKKIKVKESGNTTEKVLTTGTVSEDLQGAVSAVRRIEEVVSNLIKNISASQTMAPVEKKGLASALRELKELVEDLGYDIEFGQAQAKHDLEKKAGEAAMSQYDPH